DGAVGARRVHPVPAPFRRLDGVAPASLSRTLDRKHFIPAPRASRIRARKIRFSPTGVSPMMRRVLPFAGVAVLAVLVLTAGGSPAADDWTPLFNGKDLTGWKTFVDPKSNVEPSKIWSVKDDMIICMGDPYGYIITEKEYGDYELKLQWRWGEKVT